MSNLAIVGAISASVIIAVIWAGVVHQRAKQGFRDMCDAIKTEKDVA